MILSLSTQFRVSFIYSVIFLFITFSIEFDSNILSLTSVYPSAYLNLGANQNVWKVRMKGSFVVSLWVFHLLKNEF